MLDINSILIICVDIATKLNFNSLACSYYKVFFVEHTRSLRRLSSPIGRQLDELLVI